MIQLILFINRDDSCQLRLRTYLFFVLVDDVVELDVKKGPGSRSLKLVHGCPTCRQHGGSTENLLTVCIPLVCR
jgi:hypothetical protein